MLYDGDILVKKTKTLEREGERSEKQCVCIRSRKIVFEPFCFQRKKNETTKR